MQNAINPTEEASSVVIPVNLGESSVSKNGAGFSDSSSTVTATVKNSSATVLKSNVAPGDSSITTQPTDIGTPDAVPQDSRVIGNVLDLGEGEILLPGFLSRTPSGLMVDLKALIQAGNFPLFVERAFSANTYFQGLEYPIFQKLLYDAEGTKKLAEEFDAKGKRCEVLLAKDVVRFPEERRPLYRKVRVHGKNERAEYFFEPVHIERILPKYVAEPDENGVFQVIGSETVLEKTELDADEFIADMYNKGVRYNLSMEAIKEAMSSGKTGSVEIASQVPSKPGKDAEPKEVSNKLHRDKTPKILDDGRIDLMQHSNRFPQVEKNVRLILKIPRVFGTDGRDVSGAVINAEEPKDFSLAKSCGENTAIVSDEEGEFLVSLIDGFLVIDPKLGTISMTKELTNSKGVSARTTGCLDIDAEHFIEEMNIESEAWVRGHSFTIRGNVLGKVVSKRRDKNSTFPTQWTIRILGNVTGGKGVIENEEGDITIEGALVSRAVVIAKEGEIHLKNAEHSIIIGKKVFIENAVRCVVIADEAEIVRLESSHFGGKKLVVQEVCVHGKNTAGASESVVTMEVPDLEQFNRSKAEMKIEKSSLEELFTEKNSAYAKEKKVYDDLTEIPEVVSFRKFQGLVKEIEAKWGKLTQDQTRVFENIKTKARPHIQKIVALSTKLRADHGIVKSIQEKMDEVQARMDELDAKSAGISEGISCQIGKVHGATIVKVRKIGSGSMFLKNLTEKEQREVCESLGFPHDRKFTGSSGTFAWEFKEGAKS